MNRAENHTTPDKTKSCGFNSADMAEPRIIKRDDPEEVFTLLSSDIRVEILQTLWEVDDAVSFSELHRAVDIRDSGQFNYHLNKLVERFVRKTPDGYELTQAGKSINGAIEAGSYTLETTFEPIELEHTCSLCDGTRTLAYDDETVHIECESCEVSYHFVVPPGVFAGYTREEIPQVASRYLHTGFHQIQSGFCWFCEGRTRPTVEIEDGPEVADRDEPTSDESGENGDNGEEVPVVRYECDRCGHTATSGLSLETLNHPTVQSFHYEHGINVRDTPLWEFPVLDLDHLGVRSRQPLRASVTYSVGDESLTLVLNEDAEVVEIEA